MSTIQQRLKDFCKVNNISQDLSEQVVRAVYNVLVNIRQDEFGADLINVTNALYNLLLPNDPQYSSLRQDDFTRERLLQYQLKICSMFKIPQERCAWPIGILPSMDTFAANNGLAHWSCLDPKGNDLWMRRDGSRLTPTYVKENGFLDDLRDYDLKNPIDTLLF